MSFLLDTCVISELARPGPDTVVAREWGTLSGALRRDGVATSMADGLIAATALVHGMTLATRNVADFKPFGVQIVDPWKG